MGNGFGGYTARIGVMEYWSTGRMEYWNVGMME
jgi:hypothetical protein